MTTETALSPWGSGAPAEVTVVVSTGCHFCADAEDALAEMAREFSIHVTRVALLSPEGMDLMQEHRASMSPLVLLDDSFVSAGRLPRGRMRALLAARAQRTVVGAP